MGSFYVIFMWKKWIKIELWSSLLKGIPWLETFDLPHCVYLDYSCCQSVPVCQPFTRKHRLLQAGGQGEVTGVGAGGGGGHPLPLWPSCPPARIQCGTWGQTLSTWGAARYWGRDQNPLPAIDCSSMAVVRGCFSFLSTLLSISCPPWPCWMTQMGPWAP